MSRLPVVDSATASARQADLFAAVQAALGAVPTFAKVMANSPAVLKGYLDLAAALREGALTYDLREKIAIAVAEANNCEYCLSAHVYLARNVARMSEADITAARHGRSGDARTEAILRFAVTVNRTRGNITDSDLAAVREAGVSDEEIAEIIGNVGLNVLTNYVNTAAAVPVDFPLVTPEPSQRPC